VSGGTSVYSPLAPAGAARAAGGGAGTGREVIARRPGVTKSRVPVPPSHYQGTRMAREWPLRSFLEFGAYPGAVPCARLHAKAVLWEWGLAGLGENAELVVSEIVTNAVRASRPLVQPSVVRLWLLSERRRVLILVWDGSPRPPVPLDQAAGEIYEGGRGLMLVEALSDRWSWYRIPETGGKVVWALCSADSPVGKGAGSDG
jgi:anti-sigma regulatory factor (Ser/Thr protein kinase)